MAVEVRQGDLLGLADRSDQRALRQAREHRLTLGSAGAVSV